MTSLHRALNMKRLLCFIKKKFNWNKVLVETIRLASTTELIKFKFEKTNWKLQTISAPFDNPISELKMFQIVKLLQLNTRNSVRRPVLTSSLSEIFCTHQSGHKFLFFFLNFLEFGQFFFKFFFLSICI